MLKETELKILSSFFPEGKEITLKRIMEKSKLSYEPVYRTVKELCDKKLVFEKRFGKTSIYELNYLKEEVKLDFFFYAKERLSQFSKNNGVIAKALSLIEDVDFLAVFGSYAKGNATKESDIDIICVSSRKKEIEHEIYGLKYSTNLDFAPVVIPKKEFGKIKKENEVFWNDLVKFGIIFKGYELFYSQSYLS